eukprot:NODE_313_length_10011_cov_0.634584.p6 type:complete len:238 gc:universal NODE_313_length_10011_cov_0.634584:8158-7445(-)
MLNASDDFWLTSIIKLCIICILFSGANIYLISFVKYFRSTLKKSHLDEKDPGINDQDLLQLLIHATNSPIKTSKSPYYISSTNTAETLNIILKNLEDDDREHVKHWVSSASHAYPTLMDYNMLNDVGKELFLNELKQLIIYFGKGFGEQCETVLDAIHVLESEKSLKLSRSVAQQLLLRLNQTNKPLPFSRDACLWLNDIACKMYHDNKLTLSSYRHIQFGVFFLQQNVDIEDIEIL